MNGKWLQFEEKLFHSRLWLLINRLCGSGLVWAVLRYSNLKFSTKEATIWGPSKGTWCKINLWVVSCNLITAILTSRYKIYDSLMIGSVVDMHTWDDELMLTKLVESRDAFVECELCNAVPKLWHRELIYRAGAAPLHSLYWKGSFESQLSKHSTSLIKVYQSFDIHFLTPYVPHELN